MRVLRLISGMLCVSFIVAATSCSSPSSSEEPSNIGLPEAVFDNAKSFGPGGQVDFTFDLGATPTNLYFAFTNLDMTNPKHLPAVIDKSDNPHTAADVQPTPDYQTYQQSDTLETIESPAIRDFSRRPVTPKHTALMPRALMPRTSRSASIVDKAGDTHQFYDYLGQGDASAVDATCRYVSGIVDTPVGKRTLSIYVANDCWSADNSGGSNSTKTYTVTQAMVDTIARKFIGNGNDSIFSLATNILGPEWGDSGDARFIGFNNNVTIFLYDIQNDNIPRSSYLAGFFFSLNNYVAHSNSDVLKYSNQRIMFALDAIMFANPDPGKSWSASGYYAQQILGTLGHEFQHMINFYQKIFVAQTEKGSETWLDEMCSMMLEDLLAEKMGLNGPNGFKSATPSAANVTMGRIPRFNANPSRTLKKTDDYQLDDYSTGYAFGSYLLRNYGGAALLHNIVQNNKVDESAITSAIGQADPEFSSITMANLLSRWSIAILASPSQMKTPGYCYNTGDWITSTYNGIEYKLGSINFARYVPALSTPGLFAVDSSSAAGSSNFYIKARSLSTGLVHYTLTLPSDMMLNIYAGQ